MHVISGTYGFLPPKAAFSQARAAVNRALRYVGQHEKMIGRDLIVTSSPSRRFATFGIGSRSDVCQTCGFSRGGSWSHRVAVGSKRVLAGKVALSVANQLRRIFSENEATLYQVVDDSLNFVLRLLFDRRLVDGGILAGPRGGRAPNAPS